jgi:hypothetical protein
MIRYEVQVEIDAALAGEFELYMCRVHIPRIFATGCFASIRFERAAPELFRTVYEAPSQADLDRYLGEHAEAFRVEFRERFGGAARPSRAVWVELASWR